MWYFLPPTASIRSLPLESVPGWDSIHLLSLLTILERETGRQIALPAVLQATNLDEIYRAVVAE